MSSALLFGAISVGSACAAPNADDFRHHLQTTDCGSIEADHGIDLWVFDKKFPLTTGFFFAGSETEGVTFRKYSELSPLEYIDQNPGTSPKDAMANFAAQQASVTYYSVEREEDLTDPDFSDFEPVEWNGLALLYRSSVGGRQIETTVHQVIVRSHSELDRLRITATNPAEIAKIIACAK